MAGSASGRADCASVNEIAITVVGRDRPGIVADVSSVLAELGLNLTDSTMTLLRGHFAMTLVCAAPADGPTIDADRIEAQLRPLREVDDLLTTVREVRPGPSPQGQDGIPYTLIVHGADQLGIVAAITALLSEVGGNITDLTTRLSGSLYLLSAEVDLPATVDIDELVSRLDQIADRLSVEVSLREAEADVL